jgi:hypothetical protein
MSKSKAERMEDVYNELAPDWRGIPTKGKSMVTTNQYGHKLVTIQLTLGEDDIETLRIAGEWSDDPNLVALCEYIVKQAKLVEGKA